MNQFIWVGTTATVGKLVSTSTISSKQGNSDDITAGSMGAFRKSICREICGRGNITVQFWKLSSLSHSKLNVSSLHSFIHFIYFIYFVYFISFTFFIAYFFSQLYLITIKYYVTWSLICSYILYCYAFMLSLIYVWVVLQIVMWQMLCTCCVLLCIHYDCFYICKDLTEGEINEWINQSIMKTSHLKLFR